MAPRFLRKTLLGCETDKKLGDYLHLKGQSKNLQSQKFSKVNALREVKGLVRKKPVWAEGNIKVVLVSCLLHFSPHEHQNQLVKLHKDPVASFIRILEFVNLILKVLFFFFIKEHGSSIFSSFFSYFFSKF